MVHMRTKHPVSMYVAGKSKAETALDRLVVLTWKGNNTTGRKAHSARCFSVPRWQPDLAGGDINFVEMLVEAFEQRQKSLAHKYVTMMLDTNNGVCNDIPAEMLDTQAVLDDFLAEDSEDSSRGKLNGDQIKGWYEEKLAPVVILTLAEKKGWMADGFQMDSEQERQLQQASNGYRATLEKLAAPTPRVDIHTAKQLLKAVELLPTADRDTDMVCRKLVRKLDTIINPAATGEISLDLL